MTFTVKKLTPNIGAEVIGLDIAKGVDAETAAKLRDVLDHNYVVLIKNQTITPQQQIEYAKVYGKPDSLKGYGGTVIDSSNTGLPPEIMKITNDPNNPKSKALKGAARWHIDMTWSKRPSKASVLHVQQLPAGGTTTKWCALYPAYEALPETRKKELEKLRVIHSLEHAQRKDHPDASEAQIAEWRKVPVIEHPLVWVHKDGRKSLLLAHTIEQIVGMSKEATETLRAELEAWCTQPQYVYEHNWKDGDLLVWFNSATMHKAPSYSGPELRLLHRVTVDGDEEVTGPA